MEIEKKQKRGYGEDSKKVRVIIRMNPKQKAILKQKAALYTDGNLSHWIRAALQNYVPTVKKLDYF